MANFKLQEEEVFSGIQTYLYEVEANTIDEAVTKILDGEVDPYDCEALFDEATDAEVEDNTRKIYNDEALVWRDPINRGSLITKNLRNISRHLSLLMENEPEVFMGGDIPFPTVRKVMEKLGWMPKDFITDKNGWEIDYQIYFVKEGKDFCYLVSGGIYEGNLIITKETKMNIYTYYVQHSSKHAETVTVEAPNEEEARKSLDELFPDSTSIELVKE